MTKPAIPVRPIRTEQDHDTALARISELMPAAPDSLEGDELDILVTLVDAYESKHFPFAEPDDPLVAIEFYMDAKCLTRRDLEPMIGSRARVSEVLSGKRPLTLAMIRRLVAGLGIPAADLVSIATHPKRKKKAASPTRHTTRKQVSAAS